MALMKCFDCGEAISPNGYVCPHCGCVYKKSYLIAGILAVTPLGWFGIHNFYLEKEARGRTQLIIFFIGLFLFFIPSLFVGLWSFFEGIALFTGGQRMLDQKMGLTNRCQYIFRTPNNGEVATDEVPHL